MAVASWWAETFIDTDGITTCEAFGATRTLRYLYPSSISDGSAFGDITVRGPLQSLYPTGITSAEAFGGSTTHPGVATVGAFSTGSAETFGNPTVLPGNVNIAPSGITSAEVLGTPVLQSRQTLTPTGIASAETFGTAMVRQTITATGITSAEAFGTAVVGRGAVTITGTGITSAEAIGSASVVRNVKYDAVSSQAPTLASSWSYSHTASSGAYVVLCLVADRAVTLTNVKYDGNTMSLLGSQKLNNGSTSELFMYGIANVAAGSKTVSGTITSSYFTVNTISFLGVGSAGSVSKAYGSGTSLSQGSIACPAGKMTVQTFGTGASATTYTSLSGGTNKLNTAANGSTMCINIATADATFAATGANQPWAGLACVLSY